MKCNYCGKRDKAAVLYHGLEDYVNAMTEGTE